MDLPVYKGWIEEWFNPSSIFTLTTYTHRHIHTGLIAKNIIFSISTTGSCQCVFVGSFLPLLLLLLLCEVGELGLWHCVYQVMNS